ncbi:hypothetical protein GCM10007416_22480 [Kroppenstedtia guangzhouensis]|uniref:Uncharacterized protein n=1 Tax=Kroppenstedtia guangzhouensis TaxID=1274356 RepID=A0ABQ1GSJ9_9BACL|nr:hypothetical protein GCM10007416_22480 [Kroppenstedtia guangzhouensis]
MDKQTDDEDNDRTCQEHQGGYLFGVHGVGRFFDIDKAGGLGGHASQHPQISAGVSTQTGVSPQSNKGDPKKSQ